MAARARRRLRTAGLAGAEILMMDAERLGLGLLVWWLDNEVPYSAEELDSIFRRLTTQGVRRYLTTT